ncbi:MAG: hypothetical protein QNI96_10450 [Woeseiaceae bacterium]|nr:hypothetical protein [Woeseiaceae bacterium]
MNTIERDDELLARARDLSTGISPEQDLWPGIEAAIRRPKTSRWTPRFAQAAAIVLLVGASSGLTWLATKDQVQVVEVVPAGLVFEQASFGGRYALGVGYQEAHRDLEAQLDTELQRLSPEARAEVEENLAMIRGAIGQINAALAEEPDNPLLQELLVQTYREELALMQRVGGLTQRVMPRRDI